MIPEQRVEIFQDVKTLAAELPKIRSKLVKEYLPGTKSFQRAQWVSVRAEARRDTHIRVFTDQI